MKEKYRMSKQEKKATENYLESCRLRLGYRVIVPRWLGEFFELNDIDKRFYTVQGKLQ